MKAKEIKSILQNSLGLFLTDPLAKSGFQWRKGSLKFQRKKDDFTQSILFFFTPSRYQDDKSIGHLNIMVRFDSSTINVVANEFKGSKSKFDEIDTVINVDIGLIIGNGAIDWRPSSIDDLNKIVKNEIAPLIIDKIVPFLDNRGKIRQVLDDFEANKTYFFWTSNGEVALRAISMYSIINDIENARKVANIYLLNDEIYKERYKNVLKNLNI